MAADRPGGFQVAVCFDPDQDVAVTQAVHDSCRPGSGSLALVVGPDHRAEHLNVQLLDDLGML